MKTHTLIETETAAIATTRDAFMQSGYCEPTCFIRTRDGRAVVAFIPEMPDTPEGFTEMVRALFARVDVAQYTFALPSFAIKVEDGRVPSGSIESNPDARSCVAFISEDLLTHEKRAGACFALTPDSPKGKPALSANMLVD